MIAVDTNILVHAHRVDASFHAVAERCVITLAEGRAAWAIPWPCVHEFLGSVTRPRVFDPPRPLKAALVQVEAWLASPSVVLLAEAPGYWSELRALFGRRRGRRSAGSRRADRSCAVFTGYGSCGLPIGTSAASIASSCEIRWSPTRLANAHPATGGAARERA